MLLDVNPEESMLDEGLAREVVNRIQKLRKKVDYGSVFSILAPICCLLTYMVIMQCLAGVSWATAW